jgi:hypothetical protein
MSPDEREFGILIGKVEGIGEQISDLRRTNSDEHRHTAERFDKLETLLDGKADTATVGTHERRIDSLERTRDRASGAFEFGSFLKGIAVFVMGAVAFFLGGGHP